MSYRSINLNRERWDLLSPSHESSVLDFQTYDLSSICDDISDTNINDEVPWNYDSFMSVAKNGSRVMS
jgi:hypothetical protein